MGERRRRDRRCGGMTEGGLADNAGREAPEGAKKRRWREEERGTMARTATAATDRADPHRQGSCQLHRQGRPRPDLRAALDPTRRPPLRRDHLGAAHGEDHQRVRQDRLRADDIEVPAFWSQLATNVVVSKYFRGHIGTPQRERTVKQLIDRVVNTITAWAATQRYFARRRTWPPSRRS